MKLKNLLLLALTILLLPSWKPAYTQTGPYVKQVLTSNSGKFEYLPPYTDYVLLESYNPENSQIDKFGVIYTQSAQSILISGRFGFFTAQDSIIKYDLYTFERKAAIADSGLNRLAMYKGKLLVSKQYPNQQYFLEVLDTSNLSLIAKVPGISGDCGGICEVNDTVYVAVNGGYMGTEGKLAVVDPGSWTLKAEVNFGHEAIGIWDLYVYNGNIFTVNKTPYGVSDTGSITIYTPSTRTFTNIFLPYRVAAGSGIKDSLLYLGLNYGIGSFNLNTQAVSKPVILADPGSSVYTYILSSAIDTLNERLYVNIGDYVSNGRCQVTSFSGDSITSYRTGISSDAIAVDTRVHSSGINDGKGLQVSAFLFPNPVQDVLKVRFTGNVQLTTVKVMDISGREVLTFKPGISPDTDFEFNVSGLTQGLYYLVLSSPEGRIVKPFAVSRP
ncbi:MAG: T9SS type A sorting domain-containing protein [Bacteroidetes bacterium]|nr:T9SS type A sorting domain-containing protein [Bacteroidota bacterium]